jgi:predicted glutamine amidotransferase
MMCRLFAIISDHPCAPELPGYVVPFRALAEKHPDGWGFGWYFYGGPQLIKNPRNALRDPLFTKTHSSIDTNLLIGHLRKRSVGERTPENTQPLLYGKYIFAHNGTLHLANELLDLLPQEYRGRIQGDTDSELLFQLLLYHIDLKGDAVEGIMSTIALVKDLLGTRYSSLDFILSDSENLFVYRSCRIKPDYYAIHFLVRGPEPLKASRTLVVCSQPLTDEKWQAMGNNQLMVVNREVQIMVYDR